MEMNETERKETKKMGLEHLMANTYVTKEHIMRH